MFDETVDIFLELNSSAADPLERIKFNEFISGMLKAGSFISMVENKKINTTNLFLLILEKIEYQDFFVEMTSSKDFREAIGLLLHLHPNLVKSKFTKSYLRKKNGTQKTKTVKSKPNRARKAHL
jgi:hypothetical protein